MADLMYPGGEWEVKLEHASTPSWALQQVRRIWFAGTSSSNVIK